jgi:bacterioferritin-associated ferredoxin
LRLGHGPVVEKPVALIEGYLAHRQQREDQIKAVLQSEALTIPQIVAKVPIERHCLNYLTLYICVPQVYQDLPNDTIVAAACGNVKHHLEKLLDDGLVQASDVSPDAPTVYKAHL